MTTSRGASEDQRERMIAEAAYFRAEQRGFNGGDPVTDWLEAETEVDARLRQLAGKAGHARSGRKSSARRRASATS